MQNFCVGLLLGLLTHSQVVMAEGGLNPAADLDDTTLSSPNLTSVPLLDDVLTINSFIRSFEFIMLPIVGPPNLIS